MIYTIKRMSMNIFTKSSKKCAVALAVAVSGVWGLAGQAEAGAININFVPNPSLETGGRGSPAFWMAGSWGKLEAKFSYPVSGYQSGRAAKVTVKDYQSGDAKWFFREIPVLPGITYRFSDMYKATKGTTITLQYRLKDGSFSYVWLGDADKASDWRQFSASFTVPPGAIALTVFHLLAANGSLTVDDYFLTPFLPPSPLPPPPSLGEAMVSLVFDDGWKTAYNEALPILEAAGFKSTQYIVTETYKENFEGFMTGEDILDLASRGHEIGAHTRTHIDLTTVSPSRLLEEVAGSRQDLLDLGVPLVSTFAYPYGSYNDKIIAAVKNAGFKAARSIIEGLNFASGLDPYLLKWQGPEVTTAVSQMKSWIDEAIDQKGWLILSFHEINNLGTQYSTPPADLAAVVDYLKKKGIKVVTVAEGLEVLAK